MEKIKEIKVTCRGTKALMMQRMDDEVLEAIGTGVPKPERKDIPKEEKAKLKLYTDGNGTIIIPVGNIFASLRDAGTLEKIGKRQISTEKSTMIQGLIDIKEEEFIPLTDGNGGEPKWVVDMRKGTNSKGEATCIVRPKFNSWGFTFTLIIYEDEVSEETVRRLVTKAGRFKGLCDFRLKGRFGRFEIVRWEVLDRKESTKAD